MIETLNFGDVVGDSHAYPQTNRHINKQPAGIRIHLRLFICIRKWWTIDTLCKPSMNNNEKFKKPENIFKISTLGEQMSILFIVFHWDVAPHGWQGLQDSGKMPDYHSDSQGWQIWYSNWVRLARNGTNLEIFKISFSTFWLVEPIFSHFWSI